MLRVHIISLFPTVFRPYFEQSILGRAIEKGVVTVHYYNPIDEVSVGKRADSRPYGGGPGMVLRAEPFLRCFDKTQQYSGKKKVVFFTPNGETFTQDTAREYGSFDDLVLICGHYEGIDERVVEATRADRVSVGSYVMTGGELPAMMVTDSVVRELPGALGNRSSLEHTRVAGGAVYTRPQSFEYKGVEYSVPEVLRSGNHQDIDTYRGKTRDTC